MPYRSSFFSFSATCLRPRLRRTVLGAVMCAVGMMALPGAQAQTAYPNKPVTLLVPFPPGSATDAIGRALAAVVSKSIGQQVVVENRAGAAGTLAAGSLAQSNNPDGYTIAIAPASLFRVPHLQKVGYDPIKDLTYIMNFSGYTFSLVVPESSAWKTLPEFIEFAKANPGKVSVGASGTGSSGHVATVVLSQKSGADLTFVPFKGGSEVLAAFVGGHINSVIDGGWAQVEKQGKGRVLVTFQEKRIPRLPNVPTAREAGYDMVAASPIGLVGPKGMDPKVVKVLHDAFRAALSDPTYKRHLETYDLDDAYLSGEDYQKLAARLWVDEKRNVDMLGMKPQ
jgi:tripartite-type tricarboxylate transporter receptor subunit TctC